VESGIIPNKRIFFIALLIAGFIKWFVEVIGVAESGCAAGVAMTQSLDMPVSGEAAITESDQVFETAAEVFRVMSAPMRLKIISALCNGEKNVGELLREINTTQPNMSQHLNTLYQAGVLGKRRDGVQIYYRIINDRVVTLCRAVCMQIAIEGDYKGG
jgi:DNA-binding transcriptional ArsR family regulator